MVGLLWVLQQETGEEMVMGLVRYFSDKLTGKTHLQAEVLFLISGNEGRGSV